MPSLFKYGKGASGQTAAVVNRPTAGLNEYLPSNVINDSLMSDLIDVVPYRDDCVSFYADAAITQLGAATTATKGLIRACIHSDESTDATNVFYLMTSLAAGWKLIRQTHTISSGAVALTEFAMTMSSVPADASLVDSSSAVFKTEADTYYVFTNSHDTRLHFIKHTSTANTYAYVDLPAFPKKIVAHANRIFFIDTSNKIWWCRAGDLYSWYSMEYDADAITTTRNCANASYAIAAQPTTTRQLTATVTKTDTLDTLGILTIVGTNGLDAPQTAILTLAEGRVQTSMAFKTITSITQSGWTQGGATPDTIVVGVAPVGLGYVTDDAGYWTIEKELNLHDICLIGSNLFIFATNNIYIFQGSSYDSFALTQMISGVGIDRMITPNGYQKLTTTKNVSYFIYNGYVYEFDGDGYPKIVSRPVVLNGQSSNGIFGGISFSGEAWVLASNANFLYVYNYTGLVAYYYVYNFETKTWWKKSGMLKGNISSASEIDIKYIPFFNRQGMFNFISIFSAANDYLFSMQLGCTQGTVLPFFITKAFNTNPSETGSLTEVVLSIKGVLNSLADVVISYSLTVDTSDFTEIKRFDDYRFNGDMEIIAIPVPTAYIANAHHYRIKVEIGNVTTPPTVYVYNVERRFRLKGRSR